MNFGYSDAYVQPSVSPRKIYFGKTLAHSLFGYVSTRAQGVCIE